MTETTQVERVARAMREAVIRDDEGEFPRLFDLLDFSGENKAHTVVNALATVAIKAMSDAEPVAGQVERSAVVAWLKKEAVDCRAAMEMAPQSNMASLYLIRAVYYEQAAGMIGRGAHHTPPQPHAEPTLHEQGRDEVERLREALRPFVDGAAHTMFFLTSREKMHSCGVDLYREDVERARAALSPPLS